MEFGTRVSKRRITNKLELSNELKSRYPLALQFYSLPPTDNVTLQEFEDFAVRRLKVLRIVESIGFKHPKHSKDYKTALHQELFKNNLKGYLKKTPRLDDAEDAENYTDRREDHISHYILRLAFCRSDELRRWFILQEVDLFRYRYTNESSETVEQFFEINNLKFEPIKHEEKIKIANKLIDAGVDFSLTPTTITKEHFCKVPFLEAVDLVRSRKVYLQNGFAYVPFKELVSLIVTLFRKNLSHSLALTNRSLPTIESDTRFSSIIKNMHVRYMGQDYTSSNNSGEQITRQMIDQFSKKHFPPCMRQLHESLRQNHHLKHYGRLQYGLFLKGIGISLEEALQFWREEFSKSIGIDKFEKEHTYNIRHSFGKEGNRKNYTPYSCVKIIMTNPPGPGDNHGCPFKHSDSVILKQKLLSYGLQQQNAVEVSEISSKGHCQLACSRYFEILHRRPLDQPINHPNHYFDESRKGISDGATSNRESGLAISQSHNTSNSYSQSSQMCSQTQDSERSFFDEDDFMDVDEMFNAIPESQLKSQQ